MNEWGLSNKIVSDTYIFFISDFLSNKFSRVPSDSDDDTDSNFFCQIILEKNLYVTLDADHFLAYYVQQCYTFRKKGE